MIHIIGVFYVDDSFLGLLGPEFLKGAINSLIGLLRRIGLADNIAKSNTVTCQPLVI